jgi:hypothetical protein
MQKCGVWLKFLNNKLASFLQNNCFCFQVLHQRSELGQASPLLKRMNISVIVYFFWEKIGFWEILKVNLQIFL